MHSIEDVDLRFIERVVKEDAVMMYAVRVLQWRKLQRLVTEQGTFTEWSDWQDVPWVQEA